MRYLLDTNTISYALRRQHGIEERLRQVPRVDLLLSAVVLSEGLTGAYRSGNPSKMADLWRRYVDGWQLMPFDALSAEHYGRLRADLERRGCMIGHRDCQIAASALAFSASEGAAVTVVTDNITEFRRVPGLKVVNWVQR